MSEFEVARCRLNGVIIRRKSNNLGMESVSLDSAVELLLGDGPIDLNVFVGADGDIAAGVEFGRLGGVHVTSSFLGLVVRKLGSSHWYPLIDFRLVGVDNSVGWQKVGVGNIGGYELVESVCSGGAGGVGSLI